MTAAPSARPLKVPKMGENPVLFTKVSTVPGAGPNPRVKLRDRPLALKPLAVTGTSAAVLKVAALGVVNVWSGPLKVPSELTATR